MQNAFTHENMAMVLNPHGLADPVEIPQIKYTESFMRNFEKQHPDNWASFKKATAKTLAGLKQYRATKALKGDAAFRYRETTFLLPVLVEEITDRSELTRGIAAELLKQSLEFYSSPKEVPGLHAAENDIILNRVLEVAESVQPFFMVQQKMEVSNV